MIYNIQHITGIQDPARKAIGNWLQSGFHSCCVHFLLRDAYVCYMQAILCKFGAGSDKAPMPVGRDGAFRVSLGKEAVFAALDMIPEAASE